MGSSGMKRKGRRHLPKIQRLSERRTLAGVIMDAQDKEAGRPLTYRERQARFFQRLFQGFWRNTA